MVANDGQTKGVILFQLGFYSEVKVPPASSDLGKRPTSLAGPPRSRYCLSQFPQRSTTSKAIGPRQARKPFCATARFARRIPSSVTGTGASRLMMNTTIGSEFVAGFAVAAARRSRSCRPSRLRTVITASSLAARRSSAISWKAVPGKLRCRPSKIRIAWPIPLPCADGSGSWIPPSRHFRVCARRSGP